jgi:hypothetical protein
MRTLAVSALMGVAIAGIACGSSHRGSGGRRDGGGVDAGRCAGVRCPGAGPGCRIVADGSCCGHEECSPPPDAGPAGGICCGEGCDPPYFPVFGRTCLDDGDCFVGLHQIDCCGTRAALGLSTTEREAFFAAEGACSSMYPACGCPEGETSADDGSSCFETPVVHCDGGGCVTSCPVMMPPLGCYDYCVAVTEACTGANAQYGTIDECTSYCFEVGWRLGTRGDTSGNSLACRHYHADVAAFEPDIHCPHAGPTGAGICID